MPRREESRDLAYIVAVKGAFNAGKCHSQQAITNIGEVQVEVILSVDEAPLTLRDHRLQSPPDIPLQTSQTSALSLLVTFPLVGHART
jgi:hypothetical protein